MKENEVAQSCPTLCDPMDCNLPGFSVHGILQARVLEWVAISFFRGSSWPKDRTRVSHIVGRRFNLWATREAPKLCAISCFTMQITLAFDYYLLSHGHLMVDSPKGITLYSRQRKGNSGGVRMDPLVSFLLTANIKDPETFILLPSVTGFHASLNC